MKKKIRKLTVSETIDLVGGLQQLEKLGMPAKYALTKIALLEKKEFKKMLGDSLEEFVKFQKAGIGARAKMLGIKLSKISKEDINEQD